MSDNVVSFDNLVHYIETDALVMVKTIEICAAQVPETEKVERLRHFLELPAEIDLSLINEFPARGFRIRREENVSVETKTGFLFRKTITQTGKNRREYIFKVY